MMKKKNVDQASWNLVLRNADDGNSKLEIGKWKIGKSEIERLMSLGSLYGCVAIEAKTSKRSFLLCHGDSTKATLLFTQMERRRP